MGSPDRCDIPSCKNFRGSWGKAYLFDNVINVVEGDDDERTMTTGKHIVKDILCQRCTTKTVVGWKYIKASEDSEQYKEGKYILEAELLCTVE
jgi:hypothetical protein